MSSEEKRNVRVVDVADPADGGDGLDITFEDADTGERFTMRNAIVKGQIDAGTDTEGITEIPLRFEYFEDAER